MKNQQATISSPIFSQFTLNEEEETNEWRTNEKKNTEKLLIILIRKEKEKRTKN